MRVRVQACVIRWLDTKAVAQAWQGHALVGEKQRKITFWFAVFFGSRLFLMAEIFLSFAREIYFGPVAVALDRALPV